MNEQLNDNSVLMNQTQVWFLAVVLLGLLFTNDARAQFSSQLQSANDQLLVADCNTNGIDDTQETTAGTSSDCNQNAIPDICDLSNGPTSGFPLEVRIDAFEGHGGIFIDNQSITGPTVGWAIGGNGDFNGDGIDDLILGIPNEGGNLRGSAYVLFGNKTHLPHIIDDALFDGTNGFRVYSSLGTGMGNSVDSAGDVNGDGIDDVLVGGPYSSRAKAVLIFGRRDPFPPEVSTFTLDGTNGFATQSQVGLGYDVAGAGDLNGDGYADIAIGNLYPPGPCIWFGAPSPTPRIANCDALTGTNGFTLALATSTVSRAGDVNADGLDDLLIGAPNAGNSNRGEAYIIFGTTTGFAAQLDPATLDGTNGFVLEGIELEERSGFSVSGDFDVNGDGISDIAVSAPQAVKNEIGRAKGRVYVIFGRSSQFPAKVTPESLDGSIGFILVGHFDDALLGLVVDGAGDINADGFDDLLVTMENRFFALPFRDGIGSGKAHLILGRPSFPALLQVHPLGNPSTFAISGLTLPGFSSYLSEHPPNRVAGIGDVNADGFDDFGVGSPEFGGKAAIVLGRPRGDCNVNGIPDDCDINSSTSMDCDDDGVPDECESDCDGTSTPDDCDITIGTSTDCNSNNRPDSCDTDLGYGFDCNFNDINDICEISMGTATDCNGNLELDECDFQFGRLKDCQGNGIGDECEIVAGSSSDCNGNSRPDECDIELEVSMDTNSNAIPDECEPMVLTSIDDYDQMAVCIGGPGSTLALRCDCYDLDDSGAVDLLDFAILSRMLTPALRIPAGCCGAFGAAKGDENLSLFAGCMTGPNSSLATGCECFDLDHSGRVDLMDYAMLIEMP